MYFGAPFSAPFSMKSKSRTRFSAAITTTNRLQPVRGGDRGAESRSGLRLHRERSRERRPEVHGMVWRLRAGGYPDLALPRDPETSLQAEQSSVGATNLEEGISDS